ncbi:MAG TPA: hypothetical protein V6D28_03565 [Leptolyngbyaceae cyanobacterium]|nr:hypothetical protein [Nostocaceae cyanobacterium]
MNIADTSNNGNEIEPLNSADAPPPEEASSSLYPVVHDQDMAASNLPLLKPAADQVYETAVLENAEDSTPQDWVAEPDSAEQAFVDAEFQKLVTLNEELRNANNELYASVEKLKQELAEADRILQWQKTRSSVTESMLNQQTQELSAAQEQIQSLFQQLETSVQTVQHQELCIETYKAQLQISQQRLAQLERECSLLQTNYHEQSQQLLQSESTCRELRSRLMRQQRQTLQFKAALEKCLDTPVPPHYDTLDDSNQNFPSFHNHIVGQSRFSRKARSLFPNAQPIKPWSADSDQGSQTFHSWLEPTFTPPSQSSYPTTPFPTPENGTEEQEKHTSPQPSPSPVDEEENKSTSSTAHSPELDQQLESLIQIFFASGQESTTPVPRESATPVVDNFTPTVEKDNKAPEQPPKQPETEINPAVTTYNSWPLDFTLSLTQEPPVNSSSPQSQNDHGELEDYWADIATPPQPKLPLTDLPKESVMEKGNTKSPSPLIYPQRPPKGRKSLASVELPNFRPKSQ